MLELTGRRKVPRGGCRPFWLPRELCGCRLSGFKRANAGTAGMAPKTAWVNFRSRTWELFRNLIDALDYGCGFMGQRFSSRDSLPIIDIASLRGSAADVARIGAALDQACCEFGFFYATGHGIDPALSARMMTLARKFFALPLDQKLAIAMAHGGRAWRGYFPVDGELTSGRPDRKEGIYFGTELGPDDPRVRAGVPLHGMNLYPPLPGFRETLLTYIDNVTAVGQLLLCGIAVGLGLGPDYFLERYTRDPTVLFRIFNYPPSTAGAHDDELGVV